MDLGYNKKLILEDGSEYYGYGFGSDKEHVTEIVFNTSPVGYQEIVSDVTAVGYSPLKHAAQYP